MRCVCCVDHAEVLLLDVMAADQLIVEVVGVGLSGGGDVKVLLRVEGWREVGCRGALKAFDGVKAAKAPLRLWSGVTVLCCAEDWRELRVLGWRDGCDGTELVQEEKFDEVGAGEVVAAAVNCVVGGLAAGGPQSFMMSGVALPFLPDTRLAKSTSSPLLVVRDVAAFHAVGCFEPVLAAAPPLLEESSWSLRVCSRSMREERDLMRFMKL